MGNNKRRRFGRTPDSPQANEATHRLKIGFDARLKRVEYLKKKGEARDKIQKAMEHAYPGKLPGFLVCRNTLGPDGNLLIDEDAMAMLGSTPEMIAEAMRDELKARPGLLPETIHFVIPTDAKQVGDDWDFGETFAEQYECWNASGLFCSGDGMHASRKQPDATRRNVECIPYGSTENPGEWCQHSCKKECKNHSRLNLCLFVPGPDGKPQPLSKSLGFSAKFRVDSSSEYNPIGFIRELKAAADRVKGRLAFVTGTITFQIQRRRNESGVSPVGQIVIQLDQAELRRREQEIHQWYIEEQGYCAPKQLAAPEEQTATVTPINVEDQFGEDVERDGLPGDYDAQDITTPAEIGLTTPEMGEAQNGELTVETATVQQLAEALRGGLEAMANGDAKRYADELNDLTFGHPDGAQVDGKRIPISSVDWFFKGDTQHKQETRMSMLRAACVKAESRGWSLFGEVEG